MRVLLADDHLLLLQGLQNLLEAHGIEVAGTARDGREAVEQARKLRPDLILMDIRMPEWDGLTATRVIKAEMPETKIVVLTTSSDSADLFDAVKSGATGYLLKSMDAECLVEALHDAERDVPPFAPGLAAKLLAQFATVAGPAGPGAAGAAGPLRGDPAAMGEDVLSKRQLEILDLVAQGLPYKEVGARICLSPLTVKYHMAEIMRKLHLQNRAQVLAYYGSIAGDRAES
jgi:DNA-binding NarL/FixJ family response regulator